MVPLPVEIVGSEDNAENALSSSSHQTVMCFVLLHLNVCFSLHKMMHASIEGASLDHMDYDVVWDQILLQHATYSEILRDPETSGTHSQSGPSMT